MTSTKKNRLQPCSRASSRRYEYCRGSPANLTSLLDRRAGVTIQEVRFSSPAHLEPTRNPGKGGNIAVKSTQETPSKGGMREYEMM